jgi:predicted HTH transcriptional regulator
MICSTELRYEYCCMYKDFDSNYSSRNLLELIREGEHENQDFKYKISDSRKIARTISAFSNTSGGRLLIGVRDNGVIAGVKDEDDIYMIENATHIFLSPSVDPEILAHNIDGKVVWEINIPEGNHKPYRVEELDAMTAYYRDQDENFAANAVLIEVWKQEQANRSKRPVEFSDSERKLIDYLKVYPGISTSKAAKVMAIDRRRTVETLARLIRWEVIDWAQDQGKFEYFLD